MLDVRYAIGPVHAVRCDHALPGLHLVKRPQADPQAASGAGIGDMGA